MKLPSQHNKMAGNCEACVLKALKSRTKKLSLDNNALKTLSVSVGRLGFLETLSAKNNDLLSLPEEIANLRQVRMHVMCPPHFSTAVYIYITFLQLGYLNLGGNKLQSIPTCVCGLPKLRTLHLFRNCLTSFPNQLPSKFTIN